MVWLKFIMFFVWAAAMVLACWAFEVARMFARRMKKEAMRREESSGPEGPRSRPAAAVILPIKGVDADTPENVAALLAQDYPRYRLILAVESEGDPVLPLLREMSAPGGGDQKPGIEVVVSGIATGRSQKIQNQLAAIDRTTEADEILVFMDADARPSAEWLGKLVQPLVSPAEAGSEPIGATTGFRFYVPERPGEKLPDTFVSVINAGVAALLGPGWRNIAWGGSMAIRRQDFLAFGVRDAWQHALSDDYVLSWCVRHKARRRIQFVTSCLVGSTADFTWASFWEFATRQYRITRICAPGVWLAALGAALLYLVGLIYPLAFWLLSLVGIGPPNSLTGRVDYLLLVMFAALYIANVLRGWLLLQGGIAALPERRPALYRVRFWYTWGYPFSLAVNLVALLRSAFGRTIIWRGVRYRMHSRLETTVDRCKPGVNPAPGTAPGRLQKA